MPAGWLSPIPNTTQGAASNDNNPPAVRSAQWVGHGCAEPSDHALGRARGGFTSKLHLICDGRGLPWSIGLTNGNVNDTVMLGPALAGIRVPRHGRGQPRTRPKRLLADKGYSSAANRAMLARRRITVTIPERTDQLANRRRRGRVGGRPYAFNPTTHKRRNVVERCFNRFKQWRGITTRYDKKALNYRAGIVLASVILWLKT